MEWYNIISNKKWDGGGKMELIKQKYSKIKMGTIQLMKDNSLQKNDKKYLVQWDYIDYIHTVQSRLTYNEALKVFNIL